MLTKIISGGQTGVDLGALQVALAFDIPFGGWCPPGRLCENGRIPEQYLLIETPVERSDKAPDIPRSLRTEWNVRDSDAVLVLKPADMERDPGTEWTLQCSRIYAKPVLIIDPYQKDSSRRIAAWPEQHAIRILNVAGPAESTRRGIGSKTCALLSEVFKLNSID